MPEPMNDNARIVREALDALWISAGHDPQTWGGHPDWVPFDNGMAALKALETELATTKADLARAREEERERIIAIITDPENLICWLTPLFGHIESIHADPRFISAALAPEQKGDQP